MFSLRAEHTMTIDKFVKF